MSKKSEDVFEGQDLDVPSSEVDAALVLDLDGFEGPIDVLLALAREQKLDITQISMVALADQYLAFVADARREDLVGDLAGQGAHIRAGHAESASGVGA